MAIGTVLHLFSVCSSTNDVAKDLAHRGAVGGTVVLADEQIQGRGTKGRSWHSPPRLGLYVSVILRPPSGDVSLLPLVAGIAVAEAVSESTGLEVRLKWPNDVVWGRRKLGGILCESEFIGSELSCVIVGIGLNMNQRRTDFPPELRTIAVSLRLILKRAVPRERITGSLFRALNAWYEKFLSGRKREILRAFEAKLIFPIGKIITVRREKNQHTGIFQGFDLQARLKLDEGGREIFFSPAEILEISYNT